MKQPKDIKICGLSTPASVEAVINGGATHMGLIFFEKSPRNVSIETATKLAQQAGNRIIKVAVTVNSDDVFLDELVERVKPDALQLHGQESIERVREVKERYNLPVIKAFAIKEPGDLEVAKTYIGVSDLFLFDAKAPAGSELPGGNGVAFDWTIMDRWPKDVPYMLSGGLTASNIEQALTQSGAEAIDVSSGVESSPGIKDETRIAEFLAVTT